MGGKKSRGWHFHPVAGGPAAPGGRRAERAAGRVGSNYGSRAVKDSADELRCILLHLIPFSWRQIQLDVAGLLAASFFIYLSHSQKWTCRFVATFLLKPQSTSALSVKASRSRPEGVNKMHGSGMASGSFFDGETPFRTLKGHTGIRHSPCGKVSLVEQRRACRVGLLLAAF